MKALAALVFVTPVICMAQTQAPVPAITFEKTHHDFGKIPSDRKVSYRFKVTNTGHATLNITQLNPSCGCTSTVLGKWSLEPGESTEVEASFDPKGFRGEIRKSIQVVSNDPANESVILSFAAEVIQEIMPSSTAVFFYDMVRTVPRKATVRLASGNGQPVQVKEVKAPGAPYLSTSTKADGNDVVLDIDMDGNKLPKNKRRGVDALTVLTTSPRMPLITLNVQWELKPTVVSTPEKVTWVEPAGKALKTLVNLKQVDGSPFRVLEARSSNPLIKVEGVGKASAARQELQVSFSAAAKPGTYAETITLMLDDPNQPELTLRVSAVLR
jgi:hypothetical protein